MITEERDTLNVLNTLITLHTKSAEGYHEAFENVSDDVDLRQMFTEFAQTHQNLASELTRTVTEMGEQPDQDVAVKAVADIHQAWMNLKSMVASNDAQAILNECKTGEALIIEAYEDVLSMDELPTDIRKMLAAQITEVHAMSRRIDAKEVASA